MTVRSRQDLRRAVEDIVGWRAGIIPLWPAWVAREFLPPGKRLGCSEDLFDLGDRGAVTERWLASTTEADNRIRQEGEGLSILAVESRVPITLRDAVQAAPDILMGFGYARTHPAGLGRLAKLFDYQYRVPFHFHQMKQHAALVGRNPKDEAYYFPLGVHTGSEPETYLGLHASLLDENMRAAFLSHLQRWTGDGILSLSKAYKIVPGDGWHIPSGVLHAPGSALTLELQEDSDVFSMLQAVAGGRQMSKELMFKDVRPEDRARFGEAAIMEMIDWEANTDPLFYEHHHTPPIPIRDDPEGKEEWIFYNTSKFSGKRLTVRPKKGMTIREEGVSSFFVWNGRGRFGGVDVEAGVPGKDEAIVCDSRGRENIVVENTGDDDLEIFRFYGPDIQSDVPRIPPFEGKFSRSRS